MKKRVLSALLALCMAGSLAGTVWAAEPGQATPETAQAAEAPQPAAEEAYPEAASDAPQETAYTAEAEKDGQPLKVTVTAAENAFGDAKADAQVEAIEDETALADVAATLDGAGVEYDGFAALDVKFVDENGAEVEPEKAVKVRFELPEALLAEDADLSTLAIHHLVEDADGNVTVVEQVASVADGDIEVSDALAAAANEAAGIAALALDEETSPAEDGPEIFDDTAPAEDAPALVAEFTVDGFSTFTITWSSNSKTYDLTAYLGTMSGNGKVQGLDVSGSVDSVTVSSAITVSSFKAPAVEGYEYTGEAYFVNNQGAETKIYGLRYNNNWQYNTSSDLSSNNWQRIRSGNVYFIYREVPDISITDTIFTNGSLTAELKDPSQTVASYKWYRSAEAETDGGYAVVDDENEAALFVARDGARHYYYVEATLGDGTVLKSSPFQVPYYDALQNGSFEAPAIDNVESSYVRTYSDSKFMQIPQDLSDELVWRTSAVGSFWGNSSKPRDYYIEIVDGNTSSGAYGISGAADGNQFAELNCQVAGALYQDVMTVPGSTIHWSLEHASRNKAENTMTVVISDTKSIPDGWNPADKDQVNKDDIAATFTSNKSEWQYHTGTYIVPEGQYVTRFYFVSSSGSTDGNLLDHIGFSTDLPEPPADQGNLVITKNVEGIPEEDLGELSFTFTVKNSEGTEIKDNEGNDIVLSASNNWTKIIAVDVGEYTVTENEPGTVSGYNYSATTIEGGTVDTDATKRQTTVTVVKKENSTVTFTNTYTPATASLTITKKIAVDNEANADLSVFNNQKFTFTVKGTDTSNGSVEETAEITWTKDGTNTATVDNLPLGNYTVTETAPTGTVNNYTYVSNDDAKTVNLTTSGGTAEITNHYKRDDVTLTVSKTVGGNMGDTTKDFSFTLTVTAPQGQTINYTTIADSITVTPKDEGEMEGSYTFNTNSVTFQLHSGQQMQVTLPYGCTYAVSETADGYTPTVAVTGDNDAEKNGANVNGTMDGNITVAYTNTLTVTPPTGLNQNGTPFGVLMAAALVAGVALAGSVVNRRMRRRREE